MTRGGYCSHLLTILTVLAKKTWLKKYKEKYDQIQNNFKNMTKMKKVD